MDAFFKIDSNLLFTLVLTVVAFITSLTLTSKSRVMKILNIIALIAIICLLTESITEFLMTTVTNVTLPIKILVNITAMTTAFFAALLPTCWIYFVHFYIKKDKIEYSKNVLLGLIPFIFIGVIILSTYFTDFMFKLEFHGDTKIEYVRGPLYPLVVVVEMGYIIASLVYIFINRNELSKKEFIIFSMFEVLPVVGTSLQMINETWLLIFPCSAYTIMLSYVFLQEILVGYDKITNAWTKENFDLFIERSANKEYAISCIFLEDYIKIRNQYGLSEQKNYLSNFSRILLENKAPNYHVVYLTQNEFLIYFDTKNIHEINEYFNNVDKEIEEFNSSGILKYMIKYRKSIVIHDNKYTKNGDLIREAYNQLYDQSLR